MPARHIPTAIASLLVLASPARADDDVARWGVTIWGVSYHADDGIDYNQNNWGAVLRYYIWRHVFVEGDAPCNSNRGVVLPVSIGAELGMGTLFHSCDVSAIGA